VGLRPIELMVSSGELVVVLGPSGSGKTTLLRLIAGLEPPSSGTVWIGGQDVTGAPAHKRDVAMVFQHAVLYPHLSVFDNLAFGIRSRNYPRRQLRPTVNSIAGMLELDRLLSRRPAQLSGGERQRVAIGRAMVRRPRVILLDEPFSNLDVPLRANLRERVVDLQRRLGTTLIHVTHDQAEALAMGHRVAILDRGQLLQVDTPRTIYERPAFRFVATFVGSSPMNILPCEVAPEGEPVRIHPIAADDSLSWTTARALLPANWQVSSRRLDLGIRPEALSVAHAAPDLDQSRSAPTMAAQVLRVEFTGPDLAVTLSVGPYALVARLPSDRKFAIRDRVTLSLDMNRVTWFDSTTGAALESPRP
jgi:ABC-type sugar transport system ATPase subunit